MQILEWLSSQMIEPIPFQSLRESWFHYLSLILMIVGVVLTTRYFNKADDRKIKKYLLIFAFVLLTLEVYKQIIYTYGNSGVYRWYAFPFQFCSVPMYVALLAALTKNKRIFEATLGFLTTYGLFAGTAVMFYPVTVFVSTIGINIQTMVHHGWISVIGFGLVLSRKVDYHPKTLIKGSLVFISAVGIAIILNTIHNTWIFDGSFNMFFINPKYGSDIPIFNGY